MGKKGIVLDKADPIKNVSSEKGDKMKEGASKDEASAEARCVQINGAIELGSEDEGHCILDCHTILKAAYEVLADLDVINPSIQDGFAAAFKKLREQKVEFEFDLAKEPEVAQLVGSKETPAQPKETPTEGSLDVPSSLEADLEEDQKQEETIT